ncbi:bile acid-CoA:amino acid N-acyltransferase-like [Haliotis rufescens]|uniref:bile acid-CoA:amino acid N-acyltransferase-like n=1 Tax=Haliotis rufescens TaxID=6454 RepID=UPI00201EDAD5|nr:bile acid-CoA:amino acid N-acyltransferase-like [Haliotis rufescens]
MMFVLRGRYYTEAILRLVGSRRQTYSSLACLNVNPRVALVDERVSITANSLQPLQRVTVQAYVEEGKAVFSSCGHFLADEEGQIDVSQHASVGGTYKGVDNMGLFWSMNPVPGVSLKPLLRQADVTIPLVFRLSVMDDHIPFADLQFPSSVVLATGELQRWYKHETVRRVEVREGSLRGTLFLPAGRRVRQRDPPVHSLNELNVAA